MKLDVLVVAAHPDDAEISAGGTILRLRDAGARVGIVDMTRGEMGTRGTQADRDAEAEAANRAMDLTARFNLDLGDARVEVSVKNREALAALIRETAPEVVIAHHPRDMHPDHIATGHLAREAWYLSGLKRLAQDAGGAPARRPPFLFHFLSHVSVEPSLVVDITPVWQRKLEVVRCYGSQLESREAGDNGQHFLFGTDIEERMTTKARYFGEKVRVPYGEPLVHDGPLPIDHGLVRWLAASQG
ncbi:MAG: bacillithiol biosynthesis deacetylase BshB1 [Planctomycetota bacterium]